MTLFPLIFFLSVIYVLREERVVVVLRGMTDVPRSRGFKRMSSLQMGASSRHHTVEKRNVAIPATVQNCTNDKDRKQKHDFSIKTNIFFCTLAIMQRSHLARRENIASL